MIVNVSLIVMIDSVSIIIRVKICALVGLFGMVGEQVFLTKYLIIDIKITIV